MELPQWILISFSDLRHHNRSQIKDLVSLVLTFLTHYKCSWALVIPFALSPWLTLSSRATYFLVVAVAAGRESSNWCVRNRFLFMPLSGTFPFDLVTLGLAPPLPQLLCLFTLPEHFLSNILAECAAMLAEMLSECFEASPNKIQF